VKKFVSNKISEEYVENYYNSVEDRIVNGNTFKQGIHDKYDVKRGLRNKNGTGVLVGLTEIGEVHAYVMDENEKIPVEGKLRYRGIDVFDLVKGAQDDDRFGFEECCYLLLFGHLPSKSELQDFQNIIGAYRVLPEGFVRDMILKLPSKDIMNKLARSVLATYSFDDNPDDISTKNILKQSIELISRFPVLASYGYQAKAHYHDGKSLFIHTPKEELSTAENILRLLRPNKDYDQVEAKILDLALVLHAEHGGGNNSTFTTHVVSSSGTDTYSAIAAALGSLKGPKHGGANIKVTHMMNEIKSNVKDWSNEEEVRQYLIKILKKEAFDKSGLIYGIGHAVYTLSDPRCIMLKEKSKELAKVKERMSEFELYSLIERIAPAIFNEFKNTDKALSANVDFYSGFVYDMMDIPVEMYTPLFAISRIPGWCAHRIEEMINGGKIIRPAYKSVKGRLNYIPLEQR